MKIKRSKSKELPQPVRILFFICGIAAVCLPNWIALKAGKPVTNPAVLMTNLAWMIEEDVEPEIILEDWMFSFDDFGMKAAVELEQKPGDRMPNPGSEARIWDDKARDFSMNLKPFTEDWISEFESRGYTDFRIRY